MTPAGLLMDSQGRVLRDLRVSITDRCNFRCLYCLPESEAGQNFYRGHWAHLPTPAPVLQPTRADALAHHRGFGLNLLNSSAHRSWCRDHQARHSPMSGFVIFCPGCLAPW